MALGKEGAGTLMRCWDGGGRTEGGGRGLPAARDLGALVVAEGAVGAAHV